MSSEIAYLVYSLNNPQAFPSPQPSPGRRTSGVDPGSYEPTPGIRRVERLHKIRVRPHPLSNGMQRYTRQGRSVGESEAVECLVGDLLFAVFLRPRLRTRVMDLQKINSEE